MLFANRFSFFDKNGNNANPTATLPIAVEILQDGPNYGYGAQINAYADVTGSIIYVEIISTGTNYDSSARLRFFDINSNIS